MGHLYHGYVSHNLESSPGPPGPNSPTEWSPQANSKNLIRLLWKHGGFCVVVGARTGVQPTNMDFIYQEWLNCGFEWIDLIKDFKGKFKGNLGFSLQPIPDESLANGIGIICHVCPNKHNLVENPYSNWKSGDWIFNGWFPNANCFKPAVSLPAWLREFWNPILSTRHLFWARYNLQICACVFNMHIYICCVYIYMLRYMLCIYIYI